MTRKVVNDRMNLTRKVVKTLLNEWMKKHICICSLKKGDEKMALRNCLKEHRARLGLNQTELGKLAGVSRQTISLIERGDYSPSVTLALKLARLCGVTVEDIFDYEEDEL